MLQNHILASYFIYKAFPNPLIGIPLSFASHYVLDTVSYPSKEMEISLQSEMASNRDKVTFAFTISFLILTSTIVLFLIAKKNEFNFKFIIYMISANLPDIYGQIIPILKGKRKEALDGHKFELTHNPYIKIFLNQMLTLTGIFYLIIK